MVQNLWTLTLFLGLMKTGLGFFHGRTFRGETLETWRKTSDPTMPQPAMRGLSECFPWDSVKEHDFHQQEMRDTSVTNLQNVFHLDEMARRENNKDAALQLMTVSNTSN